MLPEGFVYVNDKDSTIIENLRYFTNENFMGKPMRGYVKPKIILTKEAANALVQVQQELLKEGYSLVIYDAYRPQKTVNDFVAWGKDLADTKMKDKYYPRISKAEIFEQGYVAEKSGHSRGSTVDLTIISVKKTVAKNGEVRFTPRTLNDGYTFLHAEDGTLDMGSGFDLLDVLSHQDSPLIPAVYLEHRNYLRSKMQKHGFEAYPEEWWHFTLKNEPYPNTYFDFDVE